MSVWLTIVGIGEDGQDGLSARARAALASARNVIGSSRTLALIPQTSARQLEWPQPFTKVVEQLKPLRGEPTVVLATGDPMNFGVARKLLTFIPKTEVNIIAHLSAFSLVAAHLGWSLPDCDCFTIHGRPAANLEAFIQPDARLIILTEDGNSVSEVCRRLVARGFAESRVTVLENMGGAKETVTSFVASARPQRSWSALNTLAVQCHAGAEARIWSRLAGLPDDAFLHDGMITKREIRAATLAALAPAPDQLLWDIGAGCGSVAIEWMRSTRGCEAIAIESEAERLKTIAENADRLGTPRLKCVTGKAPEALEKLPPPHAIFVGGGIGEAGVFETAWAALRTGGHLVANTVTLEGDQRLVTLQHQRGGELIRMDIATLTHIGAMRALRPRMSVLQWRVRKS